MADKSIGELTAASQITASDLFVLEQSGTAKKLTGQTLENWLTSYADGHGGIQTIVKTGTSGLVDTYTITYADATTSTFTVTNGAKGDQGVRTYVHIRYSTEEPVRNSDMHTFADDWMGIYVGTASTAPSSYTSYTWYKVKGETGNTGSPATLTSATVGYQISESGTTAPAGDWSTTVPTMEAGKFLWTRTVLQFNTGSPITFYSVARYGIDGTGAVSSVNSISPDGNGNVVITASNINTNGNINMQDAIDAVDNSLNNQALYYINIACQATTGNFATLSNTAITADHVVAECTFNYPEYITSDVTWTTSAGSLTLNGTCTNANCKATVVLVKKHN